MVTLPWPRACAALWLVDARGRVSDTVDGLICSACNVARVSCVLCRVACVQVRFTGYRDRPTDERKRRFVEDLQEGHSIIVSWGGGRGEGGGRVVTCLVV